MAYNDTTSCTTTGNDTCWQVWTTAGCTTATATTWTQWATSSAVDYGYGDSTTVWTRWVQGSDSYTVTVNAVPLTEEERREEQERVERAKADREEAAKRARELLESHLDDAQRKDLAERGEFEVESQSGRRYAIKRGRAGNVFSLDEQRRKTAKYCIHPEIDCPDEDTMLSQLCWLRWNEEEFLKTANATRLAA